MPQKKRGGLKLEAGRGKQEMEWGKPGSGNVADMTAGEGKKETVENWKFALLSLMVFLGIVVFSALFIQPSDFAKGITIEERPIKKIAPLQILPGETYAYEYYEKTQGINLTFTYKIKQGIGCTAIELAEAINRTFSCIDYKGNDEGGSNATLSKPYFHIFAPYMLAVEKGWKWEVSMYTEVAGDRRKRGSVEFTYAGEEIVLGRNAYKIEISSEENGIKSTAARYIDSEKRILLLEKGENYELRLVSSPWREQQQAE